MPPRPRRNPRLLTAAERREPAFRRAFVEAVLKAKAKASTAQIARLLAQGRLDAAYQLAVQAWDVAAEAWRIQVARQIRDALEAGAANAQGVTVEVAGRFDVVNPAAVRYAELRSAQLVRDVTLETQTAIRAIIRQSVADGLPPVRAARLIRDVIGLTVRQQVAVVNFRSSLAGLRAMPGGPAIQTPVGRVARASLLARLEGLVARYAARLLAQRALTIARTEIMTAANEGQRQLWQQAVADDEVRQDELEQVWIVTEDERLCDLCAPLDGARAPIGGTFPLNGGSGPPRHPNCRCTAGLAEIPRRRRRIVPPGTVRVA